MGTAAGTYSKSIKPLTIDDLLEWEEMLKDQLADRMRDLGFDPERGALLLLPARLKEHFGDQRLPDYVRYHRFVETPTLFNPLLLHLTTPQ
jgi:hypothetical protein